MRLLGFLITFATGTSALACANIVEKLDGQWKGSETTVTYRPNGGDVTRTQCRVTTLDFRATPTGFRIERCWVASCEDETAFSCSTEDLTVQDSKIIGVNENGRTQVVGSCTDDRMHFAQASSQDVWADWFFDVGSESPTMRKIFSYWNEGTIDTGAIALKRE